MAETQNLPVFWTARSQADSLTIKAYLRYHFSNREIDNYYKLLETFEKIVSSFPKLYPLTNKNKEIRRAVLSKQLAVFYLADRDKITVLAILDNRMSDTKWP